MHIDVDMHKELAGLVTRDDAEHLTEIRNHWQGILLLSLFSANDFLFSTDDFDCQ
jgi:hypothetical protein